MAARGQKFSWMRMVNNAFPNFARDDPNDVDLTPEQADNLVRYQLAMKHPRYLDEKAFFISGITGAESISKKVHKGLIKANLILPTPKGDSTAEDDKMPVNTNGVTPKFASQMAVISVHAQRKLVGLLFFWEEECTRWNLLDAEEKEILGALETNDGNRDLSVALAAVEMKRKLLPSQRGEATANVSQGQGHSLPTYS
jgi:hypothetical protein